MLTQEKLIELVEYDEKTGGFLWRVDRTGGVKAGARAGRKCAKGYVHFKVLGRQRSAHRLAWLYVYGETPPNQIDHINGVKDDNRIANLRLADSNQNNQNKRPLRGCSSALKGVSLHKQTGKWLAQIKFNGVAKNLGLYRSEEEAHEAYCLAAKAHHGQFARTS